MAMLRTILVDDEPPARRGMRRLLEAHADVDIVAEAGSLREALPLIEALAPDLVFLDIELSDGEGFELAASLPPRAHLIFVTAHPQHALRAFEAAALDYLLKPVAAHRLSRSMDRVRATRPQAAQRLTIDLGGKAVVADAPELSVLQAEGDYTRFFFADGRTFLASGLLGGFEAELSGPDFARLSRSLLINRGHVREVDWLAGGRSILVMKGLDRPLTLGRAPTRRLKEWLHDKGEDRLRAG